MTGKTISMEMMTDKFPENHSSTKMMNDATGVALMAAVMGRRRVSTTQNREATHPSTVPSVSAVKIRLKCAQRNTTRSLKIGVENDREQRLYDLYGRDEHEFRADAEADDMPHQ